MIKHDKYLGGIAMFESRKESRHQNLSLRITTDGGFLIFTFRD